MGVDLIGQENTQRARKKRSFRPSRLYIFNSFMNDARFLTNLFGKNYNKDGRESCNPIILLGEGLATSKT